jgi:conjugal transfer pilus assembly protein TraW
MMDRSLSFRRAGVAAFWLVLGAGLCLATSAGAVDVGRVGPVYAIREPDFLEDIARIVQGKVDSGEWKRIQEDALRRAKAALANPHPVDGVVTATSRRVWLFDPSVVLSQDILDARGQVMYPAGTRVNPLDTVSLPQPLLFFDGRDSRQVSAALNVMHQYHDAVTPILVAGSWQKLGREWNRRVFFDQQGKMVNQLGIHAVPALVAQQDKALRIEEFMP